MGSHGSHAMPTMGGDSNSSMMVPEAASHGMSHMTFFWSKNSEILFADWPGKSSGMYAVALIFVFFLAFAFEWLAHCQYFVRSAFMQTFRHMIRVGLAYMVMLAVMSFNGGVFLVAVLGHTLGFYLFGCGFFVEKDLDGCGQKGNSNLLGTGC